MRIVAAVLLALLCMTAPASLQDETAQGTAEKPAAFEDRVLGGFRLCKDGVGFLVVDGLILVEVLVIHREFVEPGIFLLDTDSAKACCIEESFAAKLQFETGATITLKFGQDVAIPGIMPDVGECAPLRKLTRQNAPVLQGRALNGVIGYPVLEGKTVIVDFNEFRLRFPPEEPEEDDEKGDPNEIKGAQWTIPFRMKPAPLSCDVAVNVERRAVFQISTACPASWIKRDVAAEARWRRGRKPTSFQVAGIEMRDVPVIFLFKDFEEENPAAPVVDGVLGNDFLSHFVVTLDTAGGRILLRPVPPRPPAQTPGG